MTFDPETTAPATNALPTTTAPAFRFDEHEEVDYGDERPSPTSTAATTTTKKRKEKKRTKKRERAGPGRNRDKTKPKNSKSDRDDKKDEKEIDYGSDWTEIGLDEDGELLDTSFGADHSPSNKIVDLDGKGDKRRRRNETARRHQVGG